MSRVEGSGSGVAVAVALAMPGDEVETTLLEVVAASPHAVIVRRCLDIPDLLALAQAGRLDVALIGGEVLRWDRDAIARLHAAGAGVIALAGQRTGSSEWVALGVDHVLPVSTSQAIRSDPASLIDLLRSVRSHRRDGVSGDPATRGFAHARGAVAPVTSHVGAEPFRAGDSTERHGRVVAVWGPTGAPGRSTVAVGAAHAWAQSGAEVLLIDADPYGGSLDQMLGVVDDEVPALAAACRLAHHGRLDATALVALARQVMPGVSLLTGLPRADRWPELRPGSLAQVWETARRVADIVVIDTGFCLEEDEELSYDTMAPRRNAATISALLEADDVLAVGTVDVIGMRRLVRGLDELARSVDGCTPFVVGNRGTGKGAQRAVRRQVEDILMRVGHRNEVVIVPDDVPTCRRAVREGRSPLEVAPGSAFGRAMRELTNAVHIIDVSTPDPRAIDVSSQGGGPRQGLPLNRLRRLVG